MDFPQKLSYTYWEKTYSELVIASSSDSSDSWGLQQKEMKGLSSNTHPLTLQ